MDMRVDELKAVLLDMRDVVSIEELREVINRTVDDLDTVSRIVGGREFSIQLFNPYVAEVKLNNSDKIVVSITPKDSVSVVYDKVKKFVEENLDKIVADILQNLKIKLDTINQKLKDEEDEDAEGE